MDIYVFLKQKPQWAYQPCLYIVKQMFEGNNAYRCGLSGGLQFKDSDRVYGQIWVSCGKHTKKPFAACTVSHGSSGNRLIGPECDKVDAEAVVFHEWSEEVCGVCWKILKGRPAARLQYMIGCWWNSTNLTRSLDDAHRLKYIERFESAGLRLYR